MVSTGNVLAPLGTGLVPHPSGGFIWVDDPGEPHRAHPRISVSERDGQFLAVLALGRVVLEIGTGLGVSTLYMARTAVRIDTYDPDPWVSRTIAPRLDATTIRVFSHRSEIDSMPAEYDLVFIDGYHSADAVRADLLIARAHVKPGGLIVLHDTGKQHHGPRQVAVEQGLNPIWINTENGMGLIRVGERER